MGGGGGASDLKHYLSEICCTNGCWIMEREHSELCWLMLFRVSCKRQQKGHVGPAIKMDLQKSTDTDCDILTVSLIVPVLVSNVKQASHSDATW